MSLLARQLAFCAEIAAGDDGPPPSSPGMAIYRDAYRGRLLRALEVSFERTRRWVGTEAFGAAGCHFVLGHPPRGWTLDDYGAEFPELLAGLFQQDPEVAELAWLEWHLQRAFAAVDRPTLGLAELDGVDWAMVRFAMAAGFAARPVSSDCGGVWEALAGDAAVAGDLVAQAADGVLLVWRAGLAPRWRMATATEFSALEQMAGGATFGEVAAGLDPVELGRWLAQWLAEGMFSAVA